MDVPPSPKPKWVLTSESFDGMLLWLDRDRDRAGEKYEEIRSGLIKRFRQLGWADAEELTNETFDRVARKLPEIIDTYKGDPVPYFFSVAYYVHMEQLRKPVVVSLVDIDFIVTDLVDAPDGFDNDELLDSCLEECLGHLTQASRDMILQYYRGDRDVKIRRRKELAEEMGIKLSNLRLRAQRVRAGLKKCILDCLERKASM